MKAVAVLVAGGTGTRMGGTTPKQFLPVLGKPILWHTLQAFKQALNGSIHIILVCHKDYLQEAHAIANTNSGDSSIQIIEGGETRFQSVRNGLRTIQEPCVVMVHDAVRCLITPELINYCYHQTQVHGSALPVVKATDSIRMGTFTKHTIANRNEVFIVQTPQCFTSELLQNAFEQTETEFFTDEASVMEAAGHTVVLCDGSYDNIKITRPADILLAEVILRQRAEASGT